MFEKALEQTLKDIFKVTKVSFDQPDPEAYEQGVLFVDIEDVKPLMKAKVAGAEVRGTASLVGPSAKVPFGFLSKAIEQATAEQTKDLFFYDYETNTKRFRNIVQRGLSFVYFFSTQYDPDLGSITEVKVTLEEPIP